MENIGVLGGSFNPVHNGHINMAINFIGRLNLSRLIIIPVWSPPHKNAQELLPAENRLEMCRIACSCDSRLETSEIEIERGGKSYTAETLLELANRMPKARLFLITGADMFLTLEQWKNFEQIKNLAALCACSRKAGELQKLRDCARRLEDAYDAECHIEDFPVTDVSSTQVRAIIRCGGDASELVSPKVLEYIQEKGLFRTQKDGIINV